MALFAPRAALLRKAPSCLRMLNSVKRIKNRCASYRQHTLPHRRAASRSKPPKNRHRRQNWSLWYPGGLPGGESTLRLHANVALPSDVSNSVKRIETRCACSAKVCP
nr:hypothetical protein [Methylomarinum sp. Ch1-1]MDP4519641.1 hypothetical protein [Methylomarinum sp. Ch1-1]